MLVEIVHYKLPELGEGIFEGEIVSWFVQVGDTVEEDQIIAEVQNDKAVVELPSPVSGKVLEIKVAEGTVCTVEDVIIVFETEGENREVTKPDVCGIGAKVAENVKNVAIETSMAGEATNVTEKIDKKKTMRVLATPSVRKFAREMNVPLHEVKGTGNNGRITREDVIKYAQAKDAPSISEKQNEDQITIETVSVESSSLETRTPLKGIRKAISNAMVKSKSTIPHATLIDEVDVTKLVSFRKEANEQFAEIKGTKLTYLPFITKALIAACRQFPELNASIDEDKEEIIYKNYFHIGIATDTEKGLLVPVIKDADKKNMWDIAKEVKELASRGREGKLTPNEIKGSTITITNIGSVGGMYFTPVINYPEVAILGIGRIIEKPVVKNGEITIAPMMSLSLSFDHRLIDGVVAQHAINLIKRLLENPEFLILEV